MTRPARDAARFVHALPAHVRLLDGRIVGGTVTDCSLDGACIRVSGCAGGVVEVTVTLAGTPCALLAEVVRRDAGGAIGVRWCGGDIIALRRGLMAEQRELLRRGVRPVTDRRRVVRPG